MDLVLLLLRLIHVVSGILWVGFGVFTPLMLAPALAEVGPEGGKVMAALQRRGLTTLLPILALATMLSGFWLYWRVSGGSLSAFVASRTGLTLAIGGLLSVLAYALGMTITRPAMMRANAALQSLASAATAEERESIQVTVGRLRSRSARVSRWIAVMLLLAAASMAVGRYL